MTIIRQEDLIQSIADAFQYISCYHPLDYVQALLARSRESGDFSSGLSPRAGLALLAAARAWALLGGRDHVLPEDVQAVLPAVAGHRLRPAGERPLPPDELTRRLLMAVPLP